MILQFLAVCWGDDVGEQDEDRRVVDPSPEARSSAFGAMFFAWMDNLLWRGYRKNLLYEDLPPMPRELASKSSAQQVLRTWDTSIRKHRLSFTQDRSDEKAEKEGGEKKVKLWKVLVRTYGGEYAWSSVLGLFHYCVVFAAPQILKPVIRFVQDESEEEWKGYFYIFCMVSAQVWSQTQSRHFQRLS